MDYSKYLPLSEASFYMMAALTEPSHGYAIMQKVEAMSGGSVTIGPGTMYGAFNTLEKQADRQGGRGRTAQDLCADRFRQAGAG